MKHVQLVMVMLSFNQYALYMCGFRHYEIYVDHFIVLVVVEVINENGLCYHVSSLETGHWTELENKRP